MIGQPWMDTLSAVLEACNTRLSHRWIIYMQVGVPCRIVLTTRSCLAETWFVTMNDTTVHDAIATLHLFGVRQCVRTASTVAAARTWFPAAVLHKWNTGSGSSVCTACSMHRLHCCFSHTRAGLSCASAAKHHMLLYPQFQGAAIFALLAAGWACSGAMRLRELRRVQSANRTTAGRAAAANAADKSAAPGWTGGAAAAGQPQRQQHPQHQQQQQRQPLQATGTRPFASSRGSQTSLASLGGSGNSGDGGVESAVAASEPEGWPAVSVVLPVKGRRPHSEAAWTSQLAIDYGEQHRAICER